MSNDDDIEQEKEQDKRKRWKRRKKEKKKKKRGTVTTATYDRTGSKRFTLSLPPPLSLSLSLIFIVTTAREKQNSNVNWFNCSIARRYRVSRGGVRVYSRANELSVTRARAIHAPPVTARKSVESGGGEEGKKEIERKERQKSVLETSRRTSRKVPEGDWLLRRMRMRQRHPLALSPASSFPLSPRIYRSEIHTCRLRHGEKERRDDVSKPTLILRK